MRLALVAPAIALRAGLRALLSAASAPESTQEELQVVFEAASLGEFALHAPATDVLLISADPLSRAELEQILSEQAGRLAVLLISDSASAARLLVGLPARAWGVLPLDASMEELQAAVRAVHEGLIVGAPAMLEPALWRWPEGQAPAADQEAAALTERESQVLQLLAHGYPNKQIAARLHISEHTVKFHISSIYSKLGTTNRTEAVRVGLQRGLVSL